MFCSSLLKADALDNYLANHDQAYAWKKISENETDTGKFTILELTSQKWQGSEWKHELGIFIPNKQLSRLCFLQVSGYENVKRALPFLIEFSTRTGSPSAILGSVPNQPLFNGKSEDKLLAYTLRKFIDTGDTSWPIIFPMVKSAVKAMDALSEFTLSNSSKLDNFVISGSSKRGWTSYLTAASDSRVKGLAPLVFDMLNMKAQTDWAQKWYGAQSEKIKNYTELGLIERIEEPRTTELRKWIDPYEKRARLSMPKLILLGTNDPYWLVDSQTHYYSELPGSKLIYQVPGGNHHISSDKEAISTLVNWFILLSRGEIAPEFTWKIENKDGLDSLNLVPGGKILEAVLWQADSNIRDFRGAKWQKVSKKAVDENAVFNLPKAESKYRAWVGEVTYQGPESAFKASTTAIVSNPVIP